MLIKGLNRREFIIAATQTLAAQTLVTRLAGGATSKTRVGLIQSTHRKLSRTVGPEQELDYPLVREMVWKAIEYGKPRAGSLEAKIKPGSWVLIKPNIVFLKPQPGYRTGDITDLRVTRGVMEYVAEKSKAARITVAEGGAYRRIEDPGTGEVVMQNGVRADARTLDWGDKEFPGTGGTLEQMLKEFSRKYPGKKFDYVNLSYDPVLDASGKPAFLEVPRLNGVGSFSYATRYSVTNAIRNCDFLIDVPVAKIHDQCGITACFKNYVGTAPMVVYGAPGQFWNINLHERHKVDDRIDSFIGDLAAFHPPDYNVVDAIRGLQYSEHNINKPDQMLRNNVIMAGEDTVAVDAVTARFMGFKPADIEYLLMGAARGLGTYDLNKVEIVGDELDRLVRKFAKPEQWYGPCNRQWRVSRDPDLNLSTSGSSVAATKRFVSFGDILCADKALGGPAPALAAAARVEADGHRKGFLWLGLSGKVTVELNGEKLLEEQSTKTYRVGQVRQAVELRPGLNQLVFRLRAVGEKPLQMSAVLVGPANNGDSLDGIRWSA
jgi:uncharacterized protein (DUF362 family)